MSGPFQRATALVPLALLSAAVTASLAGVAPTTAVAGPEPVSSLPDGSEVPTDAIRAPASVSTPGVVAPGLEGSIERAVASASASGIPAAALSAYQRAETVINAADKSCNISWQLIAAIGRVESDHGRFGGNALDDDGLAVPGIYGIPLNGSNDTQAISDTDAGQYDSDTRWDRAVGPMQFIPSTWSVVGVDGDNDGKRNPQDIDDAALASAVYLCSGNDDLSTTAGQRAAIFRYNHSQDYVDVVLSFMNAYLDGDFTSVPNGTRVASTFVPDPDPVRTTPTPGHGTQPTPQSPGGSTTDGDQGGSGGGDPGAGGEEPPVAPPPPPPGGGDNGGGNGTPPDLPRPPELPPVGDVITQGQKAVGDTVEDTVDETVSALSKVEATAKCLAQGLVDNPLNANDAFDVCVNKLMNP